MPKRIGNLWENFISDENWAKAKYNATHNKKKSRAIKRALKKPVTYAYELRDQVVDGTFQFYGYKDKILYEPKKRVISVARVSERILHWAAMQILEPIFEKTFLDSSYSCRKGKGQLKASQKTMEYIRHCKYCLKCDISKFYPSINKTILKREIAHKIKDEKFLNVLYRLIDTTDGNYGVPIGNYTSQIFGNIYLSQMDYYIKHVLKCKYYVRYCDDFILLGTKEECQYYREMIQKYVPEVLDMKLSKCQLFPISHGIDFLGYRHFRNKILLRKRIVKRVKKRSRKQMSKLHYTERDLSVLASTLGFTKHCQSFNLRTRYYIDFLFNLIREDVKEMISLKNKSYNNDELITLKELSNKEIIIENFQLFSKTEYENSTRVRVVLRYQGKRRVLLTGAKIIVRKLLEVDQDAFPIKVTVAKKISHNNTVYYDLI